MSLRVFTAGRKPRRHLAGTCHDLRTERCPKLCIADDTNRTSATIDAAGQQRIIRENRSDADHDPAEAMTLRLYILPRSLTGHPARRTRVCRDFTVHRHRIFHRYEWTLRRDEVEENTVQCIALRT